MDDLADLPKLTELLPLLHLQQRLFQTELSQNSGTVLIQRFLAFEKFEILQHLPQPLLNVCNLLFQIPLLFNDLRGAPNHKFGVPVRTVANQFGLDIADDRKLASNNGAAPGSNM